MSYTEPREQKSDGRMDAPAFHRNQEFIVALLKDNLSGIEGDVLEVASGSGQHAVAFAAALPHLNFWPTDLNPENLISIDAWQADRRLTNLSTAAQLDVAEPKWSLDQEKTLPEKFSAIISLNMVHISPIAVAQGLFRGAGKHLNERGRLFVYGPFKKNGEHTAPSNAEFDVSLRAQNPEWGVRDQSELEEFAQANGLVLDQAAAMPSNNFTLIFRRK
ncbi:MAG: DUF938 domain-containing protein [Rhodospirillaceae bacterium]|nr:DUF938 domain-containing protein [Rhodospirillaceae bacterium]MBT4588522.1 DUF938 domain-containing protein [Rhodospirillaceae bacterium]MBT4941208.1 DUF938 domain-containing protein [Rhodospirillaceae bacterium]MBT5938540.1 DUF938 domain-containing protein [Rhodospirillaceae bacterium]MBT7268162.1 DUF938 domain-containing protein [Rhodospirillaceae bacterium]